MKELGSGTAYNTHNTTSLIRTLKYVSDILQTEEAFTVKEYTHTHTPIPSNQVICTYENCDCTFKEKRYMLAHIKAVHLNKKVICEICGETFKHRSGLFRHKQKGHEQT